MKYAEEQKAAFKQQFAARQRRKGIKAVLLGVLSVGFAVVTDDGNGNTWLGLPGAFMVPAFVALVGGPAIFWLRLFRCPACDSTHLAGRVRPSPHFCPKCGLTLY